MTLKVLDKTCCRFTSNNASLEDNMLNGIKGSPEVVFVVREIHHITERSVLISAVGSVCVCILYVCRPYSPAQILLFSTCSVAVSRSGIYMR